MKLEPKETPDHPWYAIFALTCFFLALPAAIILAKLVLPLFFSTDEARIAFVALILIVFFFFAGTVLSSVSLVRDERPRWLAYIMVALNGLALFYWMKGIS
ncbi:MAG: hypothetical protein WD266_01385 [Balneolales bacterium]